MANSSSAYYLGRMKLNKREVPGSSKYARPCSGNPDQITTETIYCDVTIETNYFVNDTDHVMCVSGSSDALGNWEPWQAVAMDDRNYGWWSVTLKLPDHERIQWKLMVREQTTMNAVRWEDRVNRSLKVVGHIDIEAPWNCPEIIRPVRRMVAKFTMYKKKKRVGKGETKTKR